MSTPDQDLSAGLNDRARVLQEAERHAELEQLARGALDRDAENADAWFWLGLALADLQRTDEALEAFERVRSLAPHLIGAPMNAADLLMGKGLYDEADALLEQVISEYPDRWNLHAMRVRSLIGADRREEAAALATDLSGVEPEDGGRESWSGQLNTTAIELAKAGLSETAETLLLRSIALQRNAPAYDNLGIVYTHMERPLHALFAFLHAADLQPRSPRIYYNLARALTTLDPGIAACRRAVELDPDYPDVRLNLGRLLDRQGRSAEAEEQFREGVARYKSAEARSALADFLYSEDRYDEAESAALAALDLDPSDTLALRVVGDCHAERGDYARARTCYADAAEKAPDLWLPRWYMARVDAILHDRAPLLESLEAALLVDCDETIAAFESDPAMEPYQEDIGIRSVLQSASLMSGEPAPD